MCNTFQDSPLLVGVHAGVTWAADGSRSVLAVVRGDDSADASERACDKCPQEIWG
jgi:hypothetical protein